MKKPTHPPSEVTHQSEGKLGCSTSLEEQQSLKTEHRPLLVFAMLILRIYENNLSLPAKATEKRRMRGVTGSSAMLQMRALARELGHSLKNAERRWLVFCDMYLCELITAVHAPRIAMSSE